MSEYQDPHAEREAEKYENPIASREALLELIAEIGPPVRRHQIEEALGYEDEERLEALRRRLRAMERDGQLILNRRGSYVPVSQDELITGRVIGHPEGFGFLVPDGGGDDLFLSSRQMRVAMHGDRVVAHVSGIDRKGRREGAISEVLERANLTLSGRLTIDHGAAYVMPDNRRIGQNILVSMDDLNGATNGQIVVVEIIQYPTMNTLPMGRIARVLGEHMAPGMEIEVALNNYNIPSAWPHGVEAEAFAYGESVSSSDKQGRVDLRDKPLVTIDGEDAKDFDDAVYCEPTKNGWRLYVAIADVSHYVKPGTLLDKEAHNRATSVYFPGRVVPMLPETLSNGLCSINPKVDRLTMVCEMLINSEGQMVRSRFYEGVMRSHARLTYTTVSQILEKKDRKMRKQHAAVVPHLEALYDLYHALLKARNERGAIDFDTTETRIVFGEGKKIERIEPYERNDAHRLIEECMVAANVAAARFLDRNKIPGLYRVHEGVKSDKLDDVRSFLSLRGLPVPKADKPTAKEYARILRKAKGRDDFHLVQVIMLRSMLQAVYSPDNIGHFGLAHEYYAHFTSPIRRYPDLLVHRAIRHILRGGRPANFSYSHHDMVLLGEHCSANERRADEATRDVADWLKCEYMQEKVGGTFPGVISSVTAFGIFVELKDIFIEGLVHITNLKGDYYHFDPVGLTLSGERSGRVYRMGDRLDVIVARVDLDERKIDFSLADSDEQDEAPRRSDKPKSKSKPKRSTSKKAKAEKVEEPLAGDDFDDSDSADKPAKKRKRVRRRKPKGKKGSAE